MRFKAKVLYKAFRDVEVIAAVIAREEDGNRLFDVRRIILGEEVNVDMEEIISEKHFEGITVIS